MGKQGLQCKFIYMYMINMYMRMHLAKVKETLRMSAK